MGGFILRDANDRCRACRSVIKDHCHGFPDPLEPNAVDYSSIPDGPTLHGDSNMAELYTYDETTYVRKFFSYRTQHAAWQQNNDSFIHMDGLADHHSGLRWDWDLPVAVRSAGLCALLSTGVVIFGLAHLIAWDFEFPTELEQRLWRASSLLTIGILPLWYCLYWMWYAVWIYTGIFTSILVLDALASLSILIYLSYALCRVYIMVEVFRSLFYLPPDAFKATWTAGVPHFR